MAITMGWSFTATMPVHCPLECGDRLLWIKQLMRERCIRSVQHGVLIRAGGESPALSALRFA